MAASNATVALGLLSLLALASGATLIVTGASWEIEQALTVDGEPVVIDEQGHLDPSRHRIGANGTVSLAYTLSNPRPSAWSGSVHVHAQVPDAGRGSQSTTFVEEGLRLEAGGERTIQVEFEADELGLRADAVQDGCGCSFVLLEGPGPELRLTFVLEETGSTERGSL